MRRIILLVLATAFLLASSRPTHALNPFYLNAKIGNASLDASFGDRFDQVLDGDDEAWATGLGYRFGQYVAFEIQYHDLGSVPGIGSPCPQNVEACTAVVVPIEADSSATTLTAQANWPLFRKRFFLYGKLGVVSWSSDVSAVLDAANELVDDFDDEDFVFGAGFRVNFIGPFDGFAEIERLGDSFDLVNIGVTIGF